VQTGFDFHRKLEGTGFAPYPTENSTHQWLETHPHAAYCALLGKLPLPKPTLEGRLQRQLVLYEQDMGIKDPMEFFEEITRHRLLKGVLPTEFIYTSEELDALVAAFTAYLATSKPGEVVWVGNKQEGQIVLPVSELKEVYS
jgi:predicted RNase H-like nuclease